MEAPATVAVWTEHGSDVKFIRTDDEGNFELSTVDGEERPRLCAGSEWGFSDTLTLPSEGTVELVIRPVYAARIRVIDQHDAPVIPAPGGGLHFSLEESDGRAEIIHESRQVEWFLGAALEPRKPEEVVIAVRERVAFGRHEEVRVKVSYGRLGYHCEGMSLALRPVTEQLAVHRLEVERREGQRSELVISWKGLSEALRIETGVDVELCLSDIRTQAMWSWPCSTFGEATRISDIPFGTYWFWVQPEISLRIDRMEERKFQFQLSVTEQETEISIDASGLGAVEFELVDAAGDPVRQVESMVIQQILAGGAIEFAYISARNPRVDLVPAGGYAVYPERSASDASMRTLIDVFPGKVTRVRMELPERD
ncbi:MAG: hypothetical protein CMJ94_12050 [Planctomycetes bacterium]|nr:hypothetical protein [Planctomycetota bacterium]